MRRIVSVRDGIRMFEIESPEDRNKEGVVPNVFSDPPKRNESPISKVNESQKGLTVHVKNKNFFHSSFNI